MAVKAKFFVAQITRRANGSMGGYAEPVPLGEVTLRPSTGKGNEEWASSTPSGEFKMTLRGSALDQFEAWLGKDLAITFEEYPVTE